MNNILSLTNYLPNIPNFFSTPSSPAFDLQLAIKEGYPSTIQSVDPALLNTPLPNGELPLNYAIRESKHESVKTLLELGSDPLLTDDQGFNALSTAYLKEDYDLVAELLSRYISKDVQAGQEIQSNSTASKKASQIAALSQDNAKWITYIKNDKNTSIFSDKNWVQQMKDLVSENPIENLTLLTKTQSSYLHTAILLKDDQMLEKLLEHPNIGEVINLKDNSGFTPLHYAAALGKLDIMKKLIEKGAKYQTENDEEISYIALFAANIKNSSPFNISKLDAAIFLCSTVLWTAQLLPARKINGRLLQPFQTGRSLASLNLPSIVMALALTRSDLFGSYQGIFTAVNALLTANLAYHTFQGLRSCWRNASLSYQQFLMKAVVSYLPRVDILYNNARGLAAQLGFWQNAKPTPLDEFTSRDIKCFEIEKNYTEPAKHCLELSEQAYNNHDTIDAEVYAKSYDKFVYRMQLWKEGNFDSSNACNDNDTLGDCSERIVKVWDECKNGTALHSNTCKYAEEHYLDGIEHGFKSNEEYEHYRTVYRAKNKIKTVTEMDAISDKDVYKASILLFRKAMTKKEVEKLSGNELKSAFKQAALKYSPDKPTGSHKKMIEASECYKLLKKMIVE